MRVEMTRGTGIIDYTQFEVRPIAWRKAVSVPKHFADNEQDAKCYYCDDYGSNNKISRMR